MSTPERFDLLVIGAGLAGMAVALHAARLRPSARILLLSKGSATGSNTFYAQGGIAAVVDAVRDSFDQHYCDTLAAGAGHCDPEVVRGVVEDAPEAIAQLERWGVHFDRHEGQWDLGREGGHGVNRVLHLHDRTGAGISKALTQRIVATSQIEWRKGWRLMELICHGSRVLGAYVQNKSQIYRVLAGATVLASGGLGALYPLTTNPPEATGEALALAVRAGAGWRNMAFMQFHPTALYRPEGGQAFLISEALRGLGARLRNAEGKEFMYAYDRRGAMATRDIVSRAIFEEMRLSGKSCVYLDLRHLASPQLEHSFPAIHRHLLKQGIDWRRQLVPVAPAAHYLCGGLATDAQGCTGVSALYALGECASTGLHGANRLASNSLLEAAVLARRVAQHWQEHGMAPPHDWTPEPKKESHPAPNAVEEVALRQMMGSSLGIVRRRSELQAALLQMQTWSKAWTARPDCLPSAPLLQLEVAAAMLRDSLAQPGNAGVFFRQEEKPESSSQ